MASYTEFAVQGIDRPLKAEYQPTNRRAWVRIELDGGTEIALDFKDNNEYAKALAEAINNVGGFLAN